uniref:ABC-type glutathione-S-conjugate transporter n=1 Tax=Trichuris muris TaxID=70415 RepID=A0A5S6QET3_TRIMR
MLVFGLHWIWCADTKSQRFGVGTHGRASQFGKPMLAAIKLTVELVGRRSHHRKSRIQYEQFLFSTVLHPSVVTVQRCVQAEGLKDNKVKREQPSIVLSLPSSVNFNIANGVPNGSVLQWPIQSSGSGGQFKSTSVIFLFICSPYQLYVISKSRRHPLPLRPLLIGKLTVGVLLVMATTVLWILLLTYKLSGDSTISDSRFVAALLLFLGMVDLLVLQVLCRRRGIITSGTIFLSLLLFSLCGVVEFAYKIGSYNENLHPGTICFFVYYGLVLLQTFLWCWADSYEYFECIDKDHPPSPENFASFLSQILFSWFTGKAILSWRRPLVYSDLWALRDEYLSATIVPLWQSMWNVLAHDYFEKKLAATERMYGVSFKDQQVRVVSKSESVRMPKKPSLVSVLFCHWRWSTIYGTSLKVVADILQFVNPQILSLLITYVESPDQPVWNGLFYAVLMFIVSTLFTILTHLNFDHMMKLGMKVRAALTSAVFTKCLRLSNDARRESTLGEMVNLMAVDIQRITEVYGYFSMIISSPVQVVLAVYFLYNVVGPSVFSAVIFLLLLIPLNYWITSLQRKIQMKQMKLKDDRMKLVTEILNGIKVLKLYAWETSFEKQIKKIRSDEIKLLKRLAYLRAFVSFLWTCAPFLVVVVVFATYVLSDPNNILDPQTAFVALALMNLLRFPMSIIPMFLSFMVQANVSCSRVEKFLLSEEFKPNLVNRNPNQVAAVKVYKGNFAWSSNAEEPILHDINVSVNPGELVAVVGQVGCGKTSFLSAILGEMEKMSGEVSVKGTMAYVPQQAWIQNMTIKNNILFGKPFQQYLYRRVVNGCALMEDLKLFSAGDDTEIGEKGANLSGGQRQRISLARAVFQNTDIYLLDDPLSAVDSHVGQHIFEGVISNEGLLKNKTRIFVTHGLGYLKKVDRILVIRDGRISETGSYPELLVRKGAFAELIETYIKDAVEGGEELTDDSVLEEVLGDIEVVNPNLFRRLSSIRSTTSSEKSSPLRKHSSVPKMQSHESFPADDVYANHLPNVKRSMSIVEGEEHVEEAKPDGRLVEEEVTATGGVKLKVYMSYFKAIGLTTTFLILFLYVGSSSFNIGSSFWLAEWSNEGLSPETAQSIDVRLGVYAGLGLAQGLFILLATLLLSYSLVIAGLRMHEILVHNVLRSPMSFFDVTPIGRIVNRIGKDVDVVDNTLPITMRLWIISVLNVISVLLVILISTPLFAAVFVPVLVLYYAVQRIYILTSRQLKRIESVTRSPVYSHFQETLTGAAVIRAYQAEERFIRESERLLDDNQTPYYENVVSNRWLAVRLETLGNILVLAASLFAILGRDSGVSPGVVGLSISYALQLTQTLNHSVRITSDVETNIVSIERVNEYSGTPKEAPWENDNKPSKEWPEKGDVQFDNYKLRYREGLELCLKDITCFIAGGEKIGIVGRTGAGKSSLTQAIFRIVEPAGGSIRIDNVDITILGLHTLRSRLTIIPQEPVLFCGSIRMNLDPYDVYSDEQVWNALESAHLKDYVSSLPAKLQHEVLEGGENFSVGQRQLICLTRAILRKTRVLVLDEATAAVDLETDDLIQRTIRSYFADCTILTIAHRLNTIMDSNRVMVLDAGRIAEFDTPANLLSNPGGIFYSMAKDAGLI